MDNEEREPEVEWEPEVESVRIDTPGFVASARPLFSLPGLKVMEAMAIPEEERMLPLLRLMILSLDSVESYEMASMLTFGELKDALISWLSVSSALEDRMEAESESERVSVTRVNSDGR